MRLLELDKSFSSLCMLTPMISSRLTSLNSTKMLTTSKCISSAQTSPLNSACPIAYLTFPPGWVPDPKWNSWSSPIPTQDALLRCSVISINGNIIFLLVRPNAWSSLTLPFCLPPHPIYIEIWNYVGSICIIHPELISPYLYWIQILAFISTCLGRCSSLLNTSCFHLCLIVSNQQSN